MLEIKFFARFKGIDFSNWPSSLDGKLWWEFKPSKAYEVSVEFVSVNKEDKEK